MPKWSWTTAPTIAVAAMHEALSRARFEQEVAVIPPAICTTRRWNIHQAAFPIFDVEFQAADGDDRPGLRLRMDFSDWNELPPSIVLQRPDGTVITQIMAPRGGTSVFNAGPHSSFARPFICMKGSREYHTHASHTADLWDNYKNASGYDLGGIVTQIWKAWQKDRP